MLRAALGSSPCRQPRPARRRRCPATNCPSGRRGLIPPFTNHPKCSAKPLFERGFLCAFNDLRIRTVEDQLYKHVRYRPTSYVSFTALHEQAEHRYSNCANIFGNVAGCSGSKNKSLHSLWNRVYLGGMPNTLEVFKSCLLSDVGSRDFSGGAVRYPEKAR